MKCFRIFSFVFVVVILTGCVLSWRAEEYVVQTPSTTSITMDVLLDRVLRTGSSVADAALSFDFYIDRLDIALQEPDNTDGDLLTVNLPPGLQPELLYVSAIDDHIPDSGTLCDRPRFPHRCTVAFDPSFSIVTYLVKATFADGGYAEKVVTLPVPTALSEPFILFPTLVPAQESLLEIQFQDVGADEYIVDIRLCEIYGNDGINPCLNGVEYTLVRTADGSVETWYEDFSFTVGVVDDVVTVQAPLSLVFGDSIEYHVTAKKYAAINDVEMITESTSAVSF